MPIALMTPGEVSQKVAAQMREQRLAANLTQAELGERANVSVAVVRKFERSGKISLESFVKLAFVLGLCEGILAALQPKPKAAAPLDELLAPPRHVKRQRASGRTK